MQSKLALLQNFLGPVQIGVGMRDSPPSQDAFPLQGNWVLGNSLESRRINGQRLEERLHREDLGSVKIHFSSSKLSPFHLSQGQPGTRGFPGFPVSVTANL